ncbi:hypothetical protein FRB99_001935 [Tulasnella sp. 403]|nr:hypothetical protein FRB99_001935 [Tulasnella sp. 403]
MASRQPPHDDNRSAESAKLFQDPQKGTISLKTNPWMLDSARTTFTLAPSRHSMQDSHHGLDHSTSAVPLHLALPAELFIQILLIASDPPDWSTARIKMLALVSKFWYRTILATPAFWTALDARQCEGLARMVVQRSADALVDVTWDTNLRPLSQGEDSPFLNVALSQAARWRSLFLLGVCADEVIERLKDASLPALQNLFVDSDQPLDYTATPRFLKDGPSIRRLHLSLFSLTWDAPRFSNLGVLQITYLDEDFPSLQQLRTLLLASPQLERFVLGYLNTSNWSTTVTETISTDTTRFRIYLPNLKTLVFWEIPPALSLHLMAHIDAPHCTYISTDVHPTHFSPAFPSFLHTITPLLASAQRVWMHHKPGLLAIETDNVSSGQRELDSWDDTAKRRGVQLRLPIASAEWAGVVEFIDASTSLTQIRAFSLGLGESASEESFPPQALRCLGNIQEITFFANYNPVPVLEALARPQPTLNGVGREWYCPRLVAVAIMMCGTEVDVNSGLVSAVRRLVESRRTANERGRQPPFPFEHYEEPPTKLQFIRADLSLLQVLREPLEGLGVTLETFAREHSGRGYLTPSCQPSPC